MKKISVSEFDELLYSATFLRYYWTVFRGMNSTKKVNFTHSSFIRDFIENDRLAQYTCVKRTKLNKILLTEEQLVYLKKSSHITNELKNIIWKS